MTENTFYGAITGLTGRFLGKAYPMIAGETVSIGSTDGDDIRISAKAEQSLCQISYDEELQEYHVLPTERMAVFLQSGQPLGKCRKYCLPRGTRITVLDRSHRFELA